MVEYKVEKAKIIDHNGEILERYFITKDKLPMMRICQWLDSASIGSILTGRRYAYCLVNFFRYLENKNIDYKKVRSKLIIWNYMKKLMYENKKDNIIGIDSQGSYNSIYHNINIITNFYFWLDEYNNGVVDIKNIRNFTDIESKYIYKEIWGTKFFQKAKHNVSFKLKYKKRRDSHRWYSDEELECFMTSFNSKRDAAIFFIGVEGGCRIEEILTIKHNDYYPNENKIWISESKTINRYCYLPQYVCDIINDYLNAEKFEIEICLDKPIDDYLFVNIKKGKNQGGKVTQSNYRKILKRAGKRIGLNPEKVITHAGRSTKAQELIECNCNDMEIMEVMGWSSIETVKNYRKEFSPKLSKAISEKVYKRKRQKKGDADGI